MSDVLVFEEPMRRFRYLLSDGRVIDVDARRADSRLSGWLLEQCGGDPTGKRSDLCIVGSVVLPEQDTLL